MRLASWVAPHIPPHTVYAEPFCGGANVLFAKGVVPYSNANHYQEVINDNNDHLANFYRTAKSRPDELLTLVEATPYAKKDYDKSTAILNGDESADELMLAWAFYINVNLSFAGKLFAGWGRGVTGRNMAGSWHNRRLQFREVLNRLALVHFDSVDALEFIQRWDAPHTAFYCDPPYPDTSQGHYSGYTQKDFENLIEALSKAQGSFVLSCYENDAVPKDWQKVTKKTTMTATNGNDRQEDSNIETGRTEVLWIVDRSPNTRQSLKMHLWSPAKGFAGKRMVRKRRVKR